MLGLLNRNTPSFPLLLTDSIALVTFTALIAFALQII